jgi:hypothetical protein
MLLHVKFLNKHGVCADTMRIELPTQNVGRKYDQQFEETETFASKCFSYR